MKRLDNPLLVNNNLIRDDASDWYFKAVVEVAKLNKEFGIEFPGVNIMLSGINGTNQLRISFLKSSTLEESPWSTSSGRMMRP